MAKRPNEEDLSEVNEPIEKRARVAITDLLGDEAGESSASAAVNTENKEYVNGHSSKNKTPAHAEDAAVNENDLVTHVTNDLHANTGSMLPPLPQASVLPSNSIASTPYIDPAAQSQVLATGGLNETADSVVYIAFETQDHESMSNHEVIGVYSTVQEANKAVMKAFLNYCEPGCEADGRERNYGEDGTLSCTFTPEEIGESEMKFWAEGHFVKAAGPPAGWGGRDLEGEFEEAFAGVGEDDNEGEEDEE